MTYKIKRRILKSGCGERFEVYSHGKRMMTFIRLSHALEWIKATEEGIWACEGDEDQ